MEQSGLERIRRQREEAEIAELRKWIGETVRINRNIKKYNGDIEERVEDGWVVIGIEKEDGVNCAKVSKEIGLVEGSFRPNQNPNKRIAADIKLVSLGELKRLNADNTQEREDQYREIGRAVEKGIVNFLLDHGKKLPSMSDALEIYQNMQSFLRGAEFFDQKYLLKYIAQDAVFFNTNNPIVFKIDTGEMAKFDLIVRKDKKFDLIPSNDGSKEASLARRIADADFNR